MSGVGGVRGSGVGGVRGSGVGGVRGRWSGWSEGRRRHEICTYVTTFGNFHLSHSIFSSAHIQGNKFESETSFVRNTRQICVRC